MVTRRSGGGTSQMVADPEPEEAAQDEDQDAEDAAEDDTQPATAGDDDEDDGGAGEEDEEGEEEDEGAEEDSAEGAVAPEPVPIAMPRKRGRPPKRPGWDDPGKDDNSDVNTPRRGRKPRGGFRGRGRGRGGLPVTPRVIDKDGTEADVVGDEAQLPDDPDGETKVDKDGNLQDGREYRVRTFTILDRGDKLYMLSTEPARCTGYRDSYLFFAKHPTLYKVLIGDDEKRDLIERDLLPHSYKGRSIGVVTARSVFREFGARIIVGGKRIADDYKVQEGRARGDVEGELADPFDKVPEHGEEYNRNQYVAWHGASAVYHNDKPTVPAQSGVPAKRKVPVTATNWMLQHAMEAARFNASLTQVRKANRDGTYDSHTNMMLFPRHMQPTHARWERVNDHAESAARKQARPNSLTNGVNGVNGTHATDDVMFVDAGLRPPPSLRTGPSFAPVSDVVSRNYLVIDSYFQSPPSASWPPPGPSPFTAEEHDQFELPSLGLPNIDGEGLAELPRDCQEALLAAQAEEKKWTDAFGHESGSGGRAKLRIGVGAL